MKKEKKLKMVALGMSILMIVSGCSASKNAETTSETEGAAAVVEDETKEESPEKEVEQASSDNVSLKDDFYLSVNSEWMNSNEIPADKISIGGFIDLMDEVDDNLMADLNQMVAEGKDSEDTPLGNAVKYFKKANDFERLDSEGASPILENLKVIKNFKSLEDWSKNIKSQMLESYATPFSFGAVQDMKDAKIYSLYVQPVGLSLGDKSYYEEGNETGQMLLPVLEKTINDIMVLVGESEEDAAKIASDTVAFEKLYSVYTKSAEESSEMTKRYNPKTLDEFGAYSKNVDLKSLVVDMFGDKVEFIVLTNTDFFDNFDKIVNEDNWDMMKNWMYSSYALSCSSILSQEIEIAGSQLSMAMYGLQELEPREKRAYSNTSGMFSMIIGQHYGEKYFGIEAKKDVENMVSNMIDVYKDRIAKLDWMSEDTKAEAAKKLDTMAVNIGYGDKLPGVYSLYKVEESDSLYESVLKISRISIEDNYKKVGTPVDRNEWAMGAQVVNAYYSPMNNSINFPAAILQEPFYSLEQSASENYGGIGGVIAHEISHAFDTNGSKYDEFGNINDWWTADDYANFEEKTKSLVDQFNAETYLDKPVNGTLTISENIADLAGLTCALEATKELSDSNLEEFFNSWATIWRSKGRPEYEEMLLVMDVHAPNYLRGNVPVSNLDDFYATFGVEDGDGMYRAPEERIVIW